MKKWSCVIGWFCLWGIISQLLNLSTNLFFNIVQALILVAGGYAIIHFFEKRERTNRKTQSNK
ncbi:MULTISPECIES: hypothetical protein [Bacillus]|uniref:hypothetical protein n=1 Tax=Bacillus TaxID=1386 RepID=UPI00030D8B73|nr:MULTISPECIES: hypothetical protein [Bacillus]